MNLIRNERGIALVMVLILSLISLAIVAALLFMITLGTKSSGSLRLYRTVKAAGLAAVPISAELIQSRGLSVDAGLNALKADGSDTSCLHQKITLATGNWSSACVTADKSSDPTTNPDLTLDFAGVSTRNYRIYAKIVDTLWGNSEESNLVGGGGQLGGSGVTASNSGMISPPHIPFLYTIEVQAQDSDHANERSRLSILYAF